MRVNCIALLCAILIASIVVFGISFLDNLDEQLYTEHYLIAKEKAYALINSNMTISDKIVIIETSCYVVGDYKRCVVELTDDLLSKKDSVYKK